MAFSYVLVKKGKGRESPLGHSKLAHQFWFSFPPPGSGGGSSNSKTAQTDEEKQRERQRSENEHKKLEQEAINYKRDKESREARLLDLEIRRANEKDRRIKQQQQFQQHQQPSQQKSIQQHSIDSEQGTSTQSLQYPHPQQQQQQQQQPQHHLSQQQQQQQQQQQHQFPGQQSQYSQQQQHQQQQQPQTHLTHYQLNQSEKSTPTSGVTYVSELKSPFGGGGEINFSYDRSLPRAFRSRSAEKEKEAVEKRRREITEACGSKAVISTTPSPQTVTGPPPSRSVVAGPPATAAAATAAIIPILPLGVATLRDDSTESDQSLTYPPPAHPQPDAYHRIV